MQLCLRAMVELNATVRERISKQAGWRAAGIQKTGGYHMNESRWSYAHILYGIAGLIGAFLLWWSIISFTTPGYHDAITVSWLDQTLRSVNRYVWVLAVGAILLGGSLWAVIPAGVRSNQFVRIGLGSLGALLIGLCSVFIYFTLVFNPFFGFLFISPFILAGVWLIAVALGIHKRAQRVEILPE